jgi:hypothetical protein
MAYNWHQSDPFTMHLVKRHAQIFWLSQSEEGNIFAQPKNWPSLSRNVSSVNGQPNRLASSYTVCFGSGADSTKNHHSIYQIQQPQASSGLISGSCRRSFPRTCKTWWFCAKHVIFQSLWPVWNQAHHLAIGRAEDSNFNTKSYAPNI